MSDTDSVHCVFLSAFYRYASGKRFSEVINAKGHSFLAPIMTSVQSGSTATARLLMKRVTKRKFPIQHEVMIYPEQSHAGNMEMIRLRIRGQSFCHQYELLTAGHRSYSAIQALKKGTGS